MLRRRALACCAAAALAVCVLMPASGAAQSILDDPGRATFGPPPGMSMSRFGTYRRRLAALRNAQRKQRLVKDAERLVLMVESYRQSLTESMPEAEAARRMDEIAKLANAVQKTMRN